MIVYRDCDSGGGQLDNPASIGVYLGTLFNNYLWDDFNAPRQGIENVQPVIPPCADASAVSNACVQRGLYTFELSLPVQTDSSYFIVYQRCCRTSQIVNINNPQSMGATYMIELTPEAQALQNSSPTFTNYPPTFICNFFDLEFDHSAMDIDGDSLVYEFYNPFHGGGQNGGPGGNNCNTPQPSPPCAPPFALVNFDALYTDQNPMGGDPQIAIDPVTGMLTGTPNFLGQFVVGICVKEYRNGVLLSRVFRDFQFNVVDCTPTVISSMVADEVVGPKHFLVERCGETDITIQNNSPLTSDLNTWTWEFYLGTDTVYTSAWNGSFTIPDFGTYSGRLFLNKGLNCPDSAFVEILAYPGVNAEFVYDWDICTISPVEFTNLSSSGASGGIVEQYYVIQPSIDTLYETDPAVNLPFAGQYTATLYTLDSDGCEDTFEETIFWIPQPPPGIPNLAPQAICLPDTANFNILEGLSLQGSEVVWTFGDGSVSSEISPRHIYQSEGTWDISVAITNSFDCFTSDTFANAVTTKFSPITDFSYSPQTVTNLNNTVNFTSETIGNPGQWNWDFGDGAWSNAPEPQHEFRDTGLIPVSLIVWDQNGCSDTVTQIIDLVPEIRLYLPNVFSPEMATLPGNDRFGALGILPGYQEYTLSVFSRWGDLIFQSMDSSTGWDGRMQGSGEIAERGVYVYQLEITGPRGKKYRWEGSVTLL